MAAKVKARDIVEGWPRGRSCESLGTMNPFLATWRHTRYSQAESLLLVQELLADQRYRVRQQRMVDEFRRLRWSMSSPYKIGQEISVRYVGKNATVCSVMPSPWGGFQIQVECDEWLPYPGRENPRRKVWVHETWINQEAA